MAELVDARDLKSLGAGLCTDSNPVPGTNDNKELEQRIHLLRRWILC